MIETEEKPNKIKRLQTLKILPYVNPDSENMGLTSYGLVLFDGCTQREQLTYLERNGVRRWLTGLNEFAPEIQGIRDLEEKSAAIKEVRKKVAFLEQSLGANIIDIEDEKFWDKVQTAHPNNGKFWETFFIEAGNEPTFLNPEDPYDLVKISAIEAGGFSIVCKSYEDAKMAANPPKFYLDRATDTATTKTEVKKIKNKALASLQEIYSKNPSKLFYVVKNVDPNSYQYKKSTSSDAIYEWLDNYISGQGFEKSAKRAAIYFNDTCILSDEELRIRAVIADGSFYKDIVVKDGLLYHRETDTILGKSNAEVIAFFKNKLNTKVWEKLLEEVETHWND